jgi:hypothetical protein
MYTAASRAETVRKDAQMEAIMYALLVTFVTAGLIVGIVVAASSTATTRDASININQIAVTIQFVNSAADNTTTTTSASSSSSSSTGVSSTAADDSTSEGTGVSRRLLSATLDINGRHTGRPQAIAAARDIERLEYMVGSISLCHSLEFDGTAWSNPQDCWPVFASPLLNTVDYETFGVAEAMALNEGWINMMNHTTNLGSAMEIRDEHLGIAFHYVVISWLQPIRLNATLTSYNGTKLYTKAGNETYPTDAADYRVNYTLAFSDLTVGPSQLTAARMNNGGAWARLAQPFTLSEGNWTVTLAFNPDNIIYGMVDPEGVNNCTSALCDAAQHGIDFPFLAMNPIVHRVDDAVWKETYAVFVPDPVYTVRLELYYVASDNSSIWAVDAALWWDGALNAGQQLFAPSQSFAVQTNGTHWDFLSWGQAPVVGAFRRLEAIGETSTAVMGCFHGSCRNNHTNPSVHSPLADVSYTLMARTAV